MGGRGGRTVRMSAALFKIRSRVREIKSISRVSSSPPRVGISIAAEIIVLDHLSRASGTFD